MAKQKQPNNIYVYSLDISLPRERALDRRLLAIAVRADTKATALDLPSSQKLQ